MIHSRPMTQTAKEAPFPLTLPGVVTPVCGDRASFPDLEVRAFLAHAAISPCSRATGEAIKACISDFTRIGVSAFPIWASQRERLRSALGDLFDVPPAEVALTGGCTKGITDLALSLPFESTDVVLGYEGEFPANVIPWKLATEARGGRVELMSLPDPTLTDCRTRILDGLRDRLAAPDRPKWLAVSGVQFQTGLRMPLSEMVELCHSKKTRVFVDGIQGAGVVPWSLSKLGADAFFCGAHKWLLGTEGAGFAHFRTELMAELRPLTAGWLSAPDAEHFLFRGQGHLRYDRNLHSTPRVFEGSTMSSLSFAALEAGVETLRALGPPSIYNHVQRYHDRIEPALVELGLSSLRAIDPELRSGILSFRAPEGVAVPELAAALRARGVTISIPDGFVRLAPHFANPLSETELVVEAFREALSSLRGR